MWTFLGAINILLILECCVCWIGLAHTESNYHLGTSIQDKFNSVFIWKSFLFLGSHSCLFSLYFHPSCGNFFLWLNVPNFFSSWELSIPHMTQLFFPSQYFVHFYLNQFLLASDPLRMCNPTFISIVKRAIISSLFMIIYSTNIYCPQKQ